MVKINNLILVGLPGVGKTTIGKRLALELNKNFFDSDDYIEFIKKEKIKYIFKTKGEIYFRNLEKKIVDKNISLLKNYVIATGGGLPVFNNNMSKLKKIGLVIYLHLSVEKILTRENLNTRPILNNDVDKLFKLYEERNNNYKDAHIILDCNNKNIEEIVKEIKSHYLSGIN